MSCLTIAHFFSAWNVLVLRTQAGHLVKKRLSRQVKEMPAPLVLENHESQVFVLMTFTSMAEFSWERGKHESFEGFPHQEHAQRSSPESIRKE